MARGISFWRAEKDPKSQIFLLGNPIVWLPAYLSILGYLCYEFIILMLQKRKIVFNRSGYFRDMVSACWFFAIAFFLHYLPFFLMERQV